MNNIKKGVAFVVFLLFIGLTFTPSINANISKTALVEFTTEICGLKVRKQTIKLTQEEADELDALFKSIKAKLNTTESIEEAKKIFKEAVLEVNKYGLFGRLNVNKIQKLVTGEYQNTRIIKILDRMIGRNQNINNSNFFCLTAGHATNSFIMGPIAFISWIYFLFPDFLDLLFFFLYFFPVEIGGFIVLGDYSIGQHAVYYPAEGWIRTVGLTGLKKWDGKFYGQIKKFDFGMGGQFLGGIGFTGLRINYEFFNTLFLGSTLMMKVGPKHL